MSAVELAPPVFSSSVSSVSPTVLYVDDYAVNVQLMQALFDLRTGLRLRHAGSAGEALALRCAPPPALLLLDLNLPDIHGSRLLGMLRLQPGWAGVPAVAVTADHDFDALGVGFCEVWRKPLDLRHVLSRLQALVGTGADGTAQPAAGLQQDRPQPAAGQSEGWAEHRGRLAAQPTLQGSSGLQGLQRSAERPGLSGWFSDAVMRARAEGATAGGRPAGAG